MELRKVSMLPGPKKREAEIAQVQKAVKRLDSGRWCIADCCHGPAPPFSIASVNWAFPCRVLYYD